MGSKKKRSSEPDKTDAQSRQDRRQQLEEQAKQAPPGLLSELVDFLVHNKKWWLTPIILVLLLVGLLVWLSGTVVAPFIYPLF